MIKLVPLSRNNWERAAELKPADDQQDYLPSNLFSIAQSKFEPTAELFGVYHGTTMVGFAIVCTYSGIPWITRFMIDREHQDKGLGREALAALIQRYVKKPGVTELRTTISSKNAQAEYLFNNMGFVRTGELDDREFVMKLQV
jgi:diamine N-acetyltransferase